jgi:hypothetical protein
MMRGTGITSGRWSGEDLETDLMEPEFWPGLGYFKRLADESLRKNHRLNVGNSVLEKIDLPKEKFMEITKMVKELDGTKAPFEEKVERAAFRLIGEDYIESVEESHKFFEDHPDKLLKYMEACQDVEYVYDKLLGGLPYFGLRLDQSGQRLSIDEGNGWLKRHRKGVLLGLAALIGMAAGIGIYTVFKSSNKEKFLDFVTANSKTDRAAADNFYTSFSPFVDGMAGNFSVVLPAVELFSKDPAVFNEVFRNIWNNTAVKNQTGLISSTSSLFLDLGYYGSVKSLNPDGSGYSDELLRKETIQGMCNYSDAITDFNLPRHSRAALMRAGNMSQSNPIIFNFDPTNAGTHVYQSRNIPRDVWGIVNLAAERPALADQPKKYEWANRMIQQLLYDIIDNQYGAKFYDGVAHSVADGTVWQVILPFYDYMDALPAKMEKAGIGVVVPYHDSDLLKAQIPDNTSRAMTLFYLADILPQIYASAGKVVSGIEGMKAFVGGLDAKLQTMLSLYPNGTIETQYMGPKSPAYWFDQWISDRSDHGLPNTMKEMRDIDQILSKNWKHWPLIRFAFGYGRWTHPDEDWEGMFYNIAHTFKAVGIPFVHCGDYVDQNGGSGDEWGVAGMPQDVTNALKQAHPDVAIGYGNVFGALLCKNGGSADLSLGTANGGATSISSYQHFRGAYPSMNPYQTYIGDTKGKIFL